MNGKMTVLDRQDMGLRIHAGSVTRIDDPDLASRAVHEEIEIKYFYEGGATILIGSDSVSAKSGDIVVINPYEIHSPVDFGAREGRYHLFMVGLDFFGEAGIGTMDLRHLLTGKRICFQHRIRQNERLGQILLHVVEEIQGGEASYQLVVQGLLLEFFALLMRNHQVEAVCAADWEKHVQYYPVIEPALLYIRDEYSGKITVEELAHLCNVSKYHFCRVFKLVTGKTAVEYVTDYRLQIADLLLEHTSSPVGEVAKLSGFEDESYFCRCYRRKRGVSPRKNRARLS